MKVTLIPSLLLFITLAEGFPHWPANIATGTGENQDGYLQENKRVPEEPEIIYHTVSFPKKETKWHGNIINNRPNTHNNIKYLPAKLLNPKTLDENGVQKRKWYNIESRFPLPERRKFPEVDWRGFNEDVFHESFGDFTPMKRFDP